MSVASKEEIVRYVAGYIGERGLGLGEVMWLGDGGPTASKLEVLLVVGCWSLVGNRLPGRATRDRSVGYELRAALGKSKLLISLCCLDSLFIEKAETETAVLQWRLPRETGDSTTLNG